MLMDKYFVCCEQCFEKIGKRNTKAARMWLDLCALKVDQTAKVEDFIILENHDFPELRVLEMLGFVLSTDRPQSLAIKVNGHYQTHEGQDMFCLEKGMHA